MSSGPAPADHKLEILGYWTFIEHSFLMSKIRVLGQMFWKASYDFAIGV